MKIIRQLCEKYPSRRGFLVGAGYAMLVVGGAAWFVSFVAPALALTLLDPSHFSMPNGLPLSPHSWMIVCWSFTALGLAMIYFSVKELRSLRRV